jgi:hypothetical protein
VKDKRKKSLAFESWAVCYDQFYVNKKITWKLFNLFWLFSKRLLLLKRKLFQVDWSGLRDSCGLTARPAESEQLSLLSTTPLYKVNSNKVWRVSLYFNAI